jgi:hypothetical protein
MTTNPALDMQKVQSFALKLIGDITAQQMGTLSTVADRLGLCNALADAAPVTSTEFAARAGIHERYACEWLSAMACHGYIAYDDTTQRFTLPAEHAYLSGEPRQSLHRPR